MERMEDIGFYTLSNDRCQLLGPVSPMWRCELILTGNCNFNCGYCRGLRSDCRDDMPLERAKNVLDLWCQDDLQNLRFSGGEPLLYPHLLNLVAHAKRNGVKRIAVSTNGSFPLNKYLALIDEGIDDFSISLDACCSSFGEKMSRVSGAWETVVPNIRAIAQQVYVTVGIVLTENNEGQAREIVDFAHDLGVADIRIIPAAQNGRTIRGLEELSDELLGAHPILRYRVENLRAGRGVRGLEDYDTTRCYFPIDDSVVCGGFHFPCVIYMREGGTPVGRIGTEMRKERIAWSKSHNSHNDPICKRYCLDVCVDHNNKCCRCSDVLDGTRTVHI